MKRIFTLSVLMFAMLSVFGQQVDRDMVVLEIGTGTWCQYCPGASMGAHDLLENGCQVAVIKNHNGDQFANQYSNARNSYYQVTGYPTAFFDGIVKHSGGSYNQSLYNSYLPKYNQRKAVPSSFTMDMQITNNGLDYTAIVTINKVAASTATGIKLHFFVTQSHIAFNWMGQTSVDFVNRLMVPSQNGTAIDFTGVDVVEVTLNFTLNAAWPVADVEFVAGIQAQNKEFLQAIKRAAIDLNVDFMANTTNISANQPVTFTSNTTGGYIGTPETYEWSFPGATPATSTDENPTVTYTECGIHDVTLVVNRGGQIKTVVKQAYVQVGPLVNITSSPSDTSYWPFNPITLDATIDDPNATYLWQPGGETTPVITVTEAQYGLGEHEFTVTVNSMECVVERSHTVMFFGTIGMENLTAGAVRIFPNPAFRIANLQASTAGVYMFELSDITGKTLLKTDNLTLNAGELYRMGLENLPRGVYALRVSLDGNITVQKLIVR